METIAQRESHLSAGSAEITTLEREAGFTAIIGTQAGPVGFVEVEDGTPAAGLIDPVVDDVRHSIHVDDRGRLIVASYTASGDFYGHPVTLEGRVIGVEEPALVVLGRGQVWIENPSQPLAVMKDGDRPVGAISCQAGGDVVSLMNGDGHVTHSLTRSPGGDVAVVVHGKDGEELIQLGGAA